jgi:hypothetical protein
MAGFPAFLTFTSSPFRSSSFLPPRSDLLSTRRWRRRRAMQQ